MEKQKQQKKNSNDDSEQQGMVKGIDATATPWILRQPLRRTANTIVVTPLLSCCSCWLPIANVIVGSLTSTMRFPLPLFAPILLMGKLWCFCDREKCANGEGGDWRQNIQKSASRTEMLKRWSGLKMLWNVVSTPWFECYRRKRARGSGRERERERQRERQKVEVTMDKMKDRFIG